MILAPLEVEAGDGLFQASLVYIVRPCLQSGKKVQRQIEKETEGHREEPLVVEEPPPLSTSCPNASFLLLAGE